MDLQQLESILNDMQQPAYRFKQIKLAVYKELKDSFGAIENIPLPLRRDLDRLVPFSELTLTTEQQSTDGSVKALFAARDHVSIESVLIPYADGIRTVCVSTEAGCQVQLCFLCDRTFGLYQGPDGFRDCRTGAVLCQSIEASRGEGHQRRVHGGGRAFSQL